MPLETFEKLPEDRRERILSTGIGAFSRKPYTEVSTDCITQACGISKGILFHYFGSKKAFYCYCLEKAMERLTEATPADGGDDFYGILFAAMDRKMSLCLHYKDEMHMVNMASRDASGEIAEIKGEIFCKYRTAVQAESLKTLGQALSALQFKDGCRSPLAAEGLYLYINAVLNKYLLQYQSTPDRFFENRERIQAEMKAYLDMMLYGVCE